jgi:DNA invertase Pin-like site-specific DNA recombinase
MKTTSSAGPVRVAIYTRLSRESDDSTSIETQRRAAETWLAANGYADAEVTEYPDSGVSGAKPLEQRKGMAQLISDRPDVIIAWKLDRYARSVSEFLRLVAWAEAHGVALATTDNVVNTATPTGRMVAVVLAALAEWERAMITSRIVDGHATRRAQGRWSAGVPPFGYQIVRRDGAAYLEIELTQAAKVRQAVEELAAPDSKATVTSTARIVGLSEQRWRKLLKSPTFRGHREYKGELVVGPDGITPVQFADPIITAAEMKAVRRRMKALATGQDRAPRHAANLCAGLAWCYRCSGRLNGGISSAGVRLYKCKQGHTAIYAETLDQRVTEAFLRRWGGFAEYVVRLEGGNDLSDQMIEAQEQAERLTKKMASAGPLMLASLEKHADELESVYAALRAAHDPDVREVLEPTGRTLGEAWEDPGNRSRLLADVGLSVTLYPKQRSDRLDIQWASGGDDQELIDGLAELEVAK